MKNLYSINSESCINVQFVYRLQCKELLFRYSCIYIFHIITPKLSFKKDKKDLVTKKFPAILIDNERVKLNFRYMLVIT